MGSMEALMIQPIMPSVLDYRSTEITSQDTDSHASTLWAICSNGTEKTEELTSTNQSTHTMWTLITLMPDSHPTKLAITFPPTRPGEWASTPSSRTTLSTWRAASKLLQTKVLSSITLSACCSMVVDPSSTSSMSREKVFLILTQRIATLHTFANGRSLTQKMKSS